LVSRIQALRKESGLEIIDRIELTLHCSPKLYEAVKANEAYIASETLATALRLHLLDAATSSTGKEELINGEICRLLLE
jgi:isoleucyl-tRNA synthetase